MANGLDFGNFVANLQELGFYDYFLPFILIFAIVYALLEKSGVLSEKRNINAVISFAIGMILIVQQPIVEIINTFLQKASLIMVIIFVALLVIFLISGSTNVKDGVGKGVLIFIIVIALIWALSPNLGIDFPFWSFLSDRTKNLILMLLLFFIFPMVIASKKEKEGSIIKKTFENIGNLFENNGRR